MFFSSSSFSFYSNEVFLFNYLQICSSIYPFIHSMINPQVLLVYLFHFFFKKKHSS